MDIDIKFLLSGLSSAGLTQTQIAASIGCSPSVICEMASGKLGVKRPSYKIVTGLTHLAAKHGIPIAPPAKKTRNKRAAVAT